ncbi:hypothetical protein B5C34_02470 [Pacificimonas flava]|uniref:Prepilin type IV endopeptidase peptidase domain-containing protein n=2 Tax=Pacificimonas TaxID=1960290 RepID=A0A219B255_9SPHN|nr:MULTISPECIES: prepilin peptidase [Pacificimonas]MBZ6377915.1 prepilin peptidase [Pacificimonas aurantium]OWV32427.1 hypothetical protein B5C34_02470 [Pacificimonas flava]
MLPFLFWTAIAGLAVLLAYTVYSDLTSRRIPNWLTLSVALLAIPYWLGRGAADADLLRHAVFAGAAILLLLLIWQAGYWLRRRLMGGGDLKLLAALTLWLPLAPYMEMLFWMALAGAVVTLVALAENRLRKRPLPTRVPYGLAIVAGVFAVHGELIVKQFGA